MKTDSTFHRLPEGGKAREAVTFYWEGQPLTACKGDTIAAALLAAGVSHTRETPQSASPRAPFCMMGSCFECRVEVDGHQNVQGCMKAVEDGMQIRRQRV